MHYYRLIIATCLFTLFLGTALSRAAPAPASVAPAHLTVTTTIGGSSMAVAANPSFAVVGDGQGIVIYDVRGTTPIGLYRLMLPGFVQTVALDGDLLAIGAGEHVLLYQLVGSTPRLLHQYATGGTVNHLERADNRLYVATTAGLEILDVGEPATPTRLGALERTFGISRLLAEGDTIYAIGQAEEPVFTYIGSLMKINISNPGAPVIQAESSLSGSSVVAEAGLTRHGDTMFVIGDISGPRGLGQMSFEIWAFDAATLAGGSYQSFGATLNGESATDIVAYGDYLLALSTTGGMSVIDPRDPDNLQRVAQLNLGFYRTDLTMVAERAFTALYNGGLQIINLNNPTAPTLAAKAELLGPTANVAAFGDALLTVSYNDTTPGSTLSNFDLRSLSAPILGDQITIDGSAQIAFAAGAQGIHLIYDGNTDLTYFVDAQEPGKLRLSAGLRLGPTDAIAVQGDRAYIGITGPTGTTPGLAVFDISTFTVPREIGRIALPSVVTALAIADERLYMLDSAQSLVIYSLAEPATPSKLGAVTLEDRYIHMAVSDEIAYIALTNGVQIVDVRNPTAPVLGAQFAGGIEYPLLALSNGRLALMAEFRSAGDAPLQVYALAEPLAPVLLAETHPAPAPGSTNRLTGANGRFALARGSHGVSVYSILTEQLWAPLVGN